MIGQAITKNSLLLAAFAVTVAAALAITEISTRDKRDAAIREVQSQALEEVVPPELHDNVLLDDYIITTDSEFLTLKLNNKCGGKNGDDKCEKIFIARKAQAITAFILPTRAPDGYGGSINSIVGIKLDGSISGVRVIQHAETPGLGDKVETKKSKWILSFNDKSLQNLSSKEWNVKKDGGIYDQFTGATITPRAVVKSVHKALTFFAANKEQLLEQANKSNLDGTAAALEPTANVEEK